MQIRLKPHLGDVAIPANLRINDQIHRFRELCRQHGCLRPYHHFAFGQSPFPPPPPVIAALAASAAEHDYLPTAGTMALRGAIAEFYRHHFDLATRAERVVISPGSKEMIAILLAVLDGPVIIPVPSWVSYYPQARILEKDVVCVRTHAGDGYKLTPDALLDATRRSPSRQRVLILNHPNNPTGAVYSADELGELGDVCRAEDVVVISDEIYALTTFDPARFTSMAAVFPEGTIVTGGLSKDRSCGGYRLGVGVFPDGSGTLVDDVLKVAGSTYSCVAAPIQHAALAAYSLDGEVDEHMAACRGVNALAGRTMSRLVGEIDGVRSTTPEGGFYLFVDFNEQREALVRLGLETCADFCADLLRVEHAALLPGDALLLPADDFGVRCSYVDYDGESALAAWRSDRPQTPAERESFAAEHFPLLVEGAGNIARYIEQVRAGARPQHTPPD